MAMPILDHVSCTKSKLLCLTAVNCICIFQPYLTSVTFMVRPTLCLVIRIVFVFGRILKYNIQYIPTWYSNSLYCCLPKHSQLAFGLFRALVPICRCCCPQVLQPWPSSVSCRGRPNFGFGFAPNVDKWALSADIRFRPKAVVPHSVHFRFRRAAVGKFGGCRK